MKKNECKRIRSFLLRSLKNGNLRVQRFALYPRRSAATPPVKDLAFHPHLTVFERPGCVVSGAP